MLISLDIKMLSTSTLVTLPLLGQRVYCVGEKERTREKRGEEIKSMWQGQMGVINRWGWSDSLVLTVSLFHMKTPEYVKFSQVRY